MVFWYHRVHGEPRTNDTAFRGSFDTTFADFLRGVNLPGFNVDDKAGWLRMDAPEGDVESSVCHTWSDSVVGGEMLKDLLHKVVALQQGHNYCKFGVTLNL